MVSSSFKTSEVLRALDRLGFTRRSRRGKGDHIWFFKNLKCGNGDIVVQTYVDSTPKMVSPGDLRKILAAIVLTESQLHRTCDGDFDSVDYEALALKGDRDNYLPPAVKQANLRRKA